MSKNATDFDKRREKLENLVIVNLSDGIGEFLKRVKEWSFTKYPFIDKKQIDVLKKINALFKTGIKTNNRYFNFFSLFVSHDNITIEIRRYDTMKDESYLYDITKPPDGRLMIRLLRRCSKVDIKNGIECPILETLEADSWFPITVWESKKGASVDRRNQQHSGFYVIDDLDNDEKPVDEVLYHFRTRANYIISPFLTEKGEKILKESAKKKK